MALKPTQTQALMIAGVLTVLTVLFFALGYIFHFHGGFTFEFCNYAEIASNLLNGRGYTTQTFYPSEVAFLEKTGIDITTGHGTPVVFRFPLLAVWAAFWMRLAGQTDFGMALANGMAHAAWVGCLFVFGERLHNRRAALLAALLWAIQPTMIAGFDLSGHPDVLFGCLFLIHNYFFWTRLVKENTPATTSTLFAIGLLGGLCFLTRQNFAFWLPIFIFLIARCPRMRRAASVSAYLAGFFSLAGVWLIYYSTHFHRFSNPLIYDELAESTLAFAPWMEYRFFSWHIFFEPGFIKALAWKFQTYLGRSIRDMFTVWLQQIFFPLFLISLFIKTTPRLTFGRFTAILLIFQIFVFSFLRYENLGLLSGRYFLWFAPLVLLEAMALLERWPLSKNKAGFVRAGVLSLALLYWGAAFRYLPSRHSGHSSQTDIEQWEEMVYLKENTKPSDWIISNIPTQITWYLKRPTISLPNTLADFGRLVEKYPVNDLFLSTHFCGEPFNYPAWQKIFASRTDTPPELQQQGFRLARVFPDGILFHRDQGPQQ